MEVLSQVPQSEFGVYHLACIYIGNLKFSLQMKGISLDAVIQRHIKSAIYLDTFGGKDYYSIK